MWATWKNTEDERERVAEYFEVTPSQVELLQGGWLLIHYREQDGELVYDLNRHGYESEEGWVFYAYGLYPTREEALQARDPSNRPAW